jgi:ketosteroid isomerase-like protein
LGEAQARDIKQNQSMSRTTSKLQAATLGGSPDDVEAAFYDALRSGEVDKIMACWADEDDIACIHPGGTRLLGTAAIRAAFEAMFSNGGAIPVTAEHIRRVDSVASAVHHVLERVDMLTPQGAMQAFVLATNVYHKTAQGWRLVVHHASPGSVEAAQDMNPSPKVLH